MVGLMLGLAKGLAASIVLFPAHQIGHALPWRGADVSFIPQIEGWGGKYFEDKKALDPLLIMKRHGLNAVRLRIWENPPDGICNLEYTIKLAKRAKALGLKILLDFHYSDSWADPGHQPKPKAWAGLSLLSIGIALHDTTLNTLKAMSAAGASPDMVQVGNEITAGLVWPDAQIIKGTEEEYLNVARLIASGLRAVHEANPTIRTMIHIDRGGDNMGARYFFDHVFAAANKHQVDMRFDVIGLSYYPLWHGKPEQLEQNLNDLAARYSKDVMVVETAYPWTFAKHGTGELGDRLWSDESKLVDGCPATPGGQTKFLRHLVSIVERVPLGRGIGVMYWAPDWLDTPGHHSAGDNLNWYDFEGHLLPGINALGM
jgi:arabinogalactan endo-1,4-beta-galactosidase